MRQKERDKGREEKKRRAVGRDSRRRGESKGESGAQGERRGVKEGRMAVISATGTRKRILDGYLPCSTFVGAPSLLSLSLSFSLPPPFSLVLPPTTRHHPGVSLFLPRALQGCKHDALTVHNAARGGMAALCSSVCIYTYIEPIRRRKRAKPRQGRFACSATAVGQEAEERLGRARDLVLAGTRSRTFSFRGQQFRTGAYAPERKARTLALTLLSLSLLRFRK